MQKATVAFTESDFANYPFLKQTSKRIEKLELTIQNLINPENAPILNRAQQRIENAINNVTVGDMVKDKTTEISSFPTAIILALATKSSLIKKRYALSEAKTAYNKMLSEPKTKILAIAQDFDWDLTLNVGQLPYDFCLSFNSYLQNASHLRDGKWKLVNRVLSNGKVYLNHAETVRLLQEAIKNRIEKRLDLSELKNLPNGISEIADKLNLLAQETIGQELDSLPKVVVQEAFPPCVNALYAAASQNRHLSHIGRFTLTSFLVNVGMSPEKLTELFRSFSDFNERLTSYQVEHIAGERGSGTKYKPPQCSVLKTHGVCVNSDELCRRIYHPLGYYKRKTQSK
jgi:DNA primase large subunit